MDWSIYTLIDIVIDYCMACSLESSTRTHTLICDCNRLLADNMEGSVCVHIYHCSRHLAGSTDWSLYITVPKLVCTSVSVSPVSVSPVRVSPVNVSPVVKKTATVQTWLTLVFPEHICGYIYLCVRIREMTDRVEERASVVVFITLDKPLVLRLSADTGAWLLESIHRFDFRERSHTHICR